MLKKHLSKAIPLPPFLPHHIPAYLHISVSLIGAYENYSYTTFQESLMLVSCVNSTSA